jgi:hypothetical protein
MPQLLDYNSIRAAGGRIGPKNVNSYRNTHDNTDRDRFERAPHNIPSEKIDTSAFTSANFLAIFLDTH